MNRKLLRRLFFWNVGVYLVAAALFIYYYMLPLASFTAASSTGGAGGNAPFFSFIIPTPTPFSSNEVIPPITPLAIDTPVASIAPGLAGTPTTSAPPTAVPVQYAGLLPSSALNIIILGTDRRPGQSNWRTDTLILLSVDQVNHSVGLLSIPRDLWVQIPGIGPQRINTADFYGEYYHLPGGGPETIKRTIEQNLGIHVHYYARVGFDGFRQAVDTLGGIDVDVDCALQENNFIDDYGRVNLNFQPGPQHMDGITALRYARSRYTTSDYDRSRRQRKVLLALWDKALSLNLLPKWPELYNQFRDSVQTDLGPTELAGLAFIGSQLHMDRIKSRAVDNRTTIPWTGPNGESVLLPQADKIRSLLVDFFAPPSTGPDPFETEHARVEVLSGNGQVASTAALTLKRQGFEIAESQQTPSLARTSSIVVYHQKPATVDRLLSALRLGADKVQEANGTDSNVDIQVILGSDYSTCQR